MTLVLKFGGSCVGDAGMAAKSLAIIEQTRQRQPAAEGLPVVAVTSALSGVTDLLVGLCDGLGEQQVSRTLGELQARHQALLAELVPAGEVRGAAAASIGERFEKAERLLFGAVYTEELTPRTRDLVLSTGERVAAILLAAALRSRLGDPGGRAVDADAAGMVVSPHHGAAIVQLEESSRRLPSSLRQAGHDGAIPVLTGYFGITPEGHCATLGRNGTDYSAAVTAYVLDAERVEIWKDVDGFLSADPRLVPEAFTIDRLNYDEAEELAYFGARVLHPRAVEVSRARQIPLVIKDLDAPTAPGTLIGPNGAVHAQVLKSVAYLPGLSTIKVSGSACGYEPGTLELIAGTFRQAGVNILSATTSQTCVSLLVSRREMEVAVRALERLTTHGVIQRVETDPHTALVCAVGAGLGSTKGLAARVFTAVARRNINVHLISAGASMVAYHFTVHEDDLTATLRAVHAEFFPSAHQRG